MINIIPEIFLLLSSFTLLIISVFSKTFNKFLNYIMLALLAGLIFIIYFNVELRMDWRYARLR